MMSLSVLSFTYGTRFIKTAPAIFLSMGEYQYKLISNPIKLYCMVPYLNIKRKRISKSLT